PGGGREVASGVHGGAAAAAEPLPRELLLGAALGAGELTAALFAGLHLEQRLGLVALGAEPLHQLGWHVHAAPSAYFSNRATLASTPAMNSRAPQSQSSTGSADVQMAHHSGCTSRGSSSREALIGSSPRACAGRPDTCARSS